MLHSMNVFSHQSLLDLVLFETLATSKRLNHQYWRIRDILSTQPVNTSWTVRVGFSFLRSIQWSESNRRSSYAYERNVIFLSLLFSADQFDSRSIEHESVNFELSFDQGAPSLWSLVTLACLCARLKTSCLNHNNCLPRWSFSERTSRYARYSNTPRIICSRDDDWHQSCENLVWFQDFYSSPARRWWGGTSVWITTTVSKHQHLHKSSDCGTSDEHDPWRRWKSRITFTRVRPFDRHINKTTQSNGFSFQ